MSQGGSDGTGRVSGGERRPDLTIGSEASTTVPEDGAPVSPGLPGDDLWIVGGRAPAREEIPADTGIGWDTTRVPAEELADARIDWELTGVEGPGDVMAFEPGGVEGEGATAEPKVVFDSTEGLPDALALPAARRGALAWAFTRAGDYRISSRATAELASGDSARTDTVWTVRVTDERSAPPAGPPAAPDGGEGAVQRGDDSAPARSRTDEAPDRKAAADGIASERAVIADGHVDAIAGKMVNGTLRTLFRDSRDPGDIIWREPSSVVLHVSPAAKERIPAGDTYSFLGRAGGDFWLIPQVQKQGVVWAGWNTEALGDGDLKGQVDMKLTKVSGPGTLAIWETAGLGGAQVLYNSADGLPDAQKVNPGVHAHGNWAFSKEGTYRVTFQLSGTSANGTAMSDAQTYTFVVGDGDPNAATPGDGDGDGAATGSGGGEDGAASGPADTDGSASGSTGGTGGAGGGAATGGDGKGSLAHTGTDLAVPFGIGAGLLVAGGGAAIAMSRANRRRTAAGHRAVRI
ncbi:choice-of-anchor M domain-containing protein [Streptomyces castrisilvae]|uniref:Choice-of-anchor M domain-containing protein n=1 Tax=Streptomyces castrisilvae TaxID=3033811 RepID=A0ABY9HUU2_9ACTN|nr:choice-of-anchor M domain-containing protein [Streptomyces sp. Mut1]WLQ38346.1 choice-of-anchor M domain-containing protein [Streptomyces sp. Mut1]